MHRFSLKNALLATFAIASISILNASVRKTTAMNTSAADEAAIRENVRLMEAGWNTKQAALFGKPFAEDADYVVVNGRYLQGREVIEKAHQQIFTTVFKDTTIRLTVKQIRFLRPDVAVVHVSGHRDGPEKEFIADALMTLVMTRDKQGWRIAAFQNTQVVNTTK